MQIPEVAVTARLVRGEERRGVTMFMMDAAEGELRDGVPSPHFPAEAMQNGRRLTVVLRGALGLATRKYFVVSDGQGQRKEESVKRMNQVGGAGCKAGSVLDA